MDALTAAVSITADPCAMLGAEVERIVVVAATAAFTVTVTALEDDPLNVPVPLYSAVMELMPAGRADVVKPATAADSVAVPRTAPPL